MLSPKFFLDKLLSAGIDFYAGVPDSLLKNLCAYITDTMPVSNHIITANEGGALAMAAGHYLATGHPGMVYMQNSGEGNIINPLASLIDKDVYGIPALLVVGWRGKPGVKDEPQHVKQGKITVALLDVMEVPNAILSRDEAESAAQIATAVDVVNHGGVYALIVEKDTFESYQPLNMTETRQFGLTRESAIRKVASRIDSTDVIVSSTGMISRELYEYRTSMGMRHERDFLTVGSMGHASMIALGIALAQPNRRVYCLDGDGAAIMHMGNMAIVGQQKLDNYVHVVLNNGAHDSVGGQPTVGLGIDIPRVAHALGYNTVCHVESHDELEEALNRLRDAKGSTLIEICVDKGNRADLGRPTTTPEHNKTKFMKFLAQ